MSTDTPILPCSDFAQIKIIPGPSSSSSSHPLDSPSFDIPPSILPHLETASKHLHNHETVAVPTETVYGLAASSLDPEACQAVYRIKRRPADNPLIMHVSSLHMLRTLLPQEYAISELYMAFITSFWPGPLSILFPAINPPSPPAPQTNAIRMPSHPLALALIHHSNLPLSAPSANSSGRPSPTRAEHVYNDLNGAKGLGCILDGGDCGVGVESTVINGLGWIKGGGGSVDILRPGGLGIERIKEVVDRFDGKEGLTKVLLHGQPWKPARHQSNGDTSISTDGHSAISDLTAKPATAEAKGKSVELPPSTPGLKYRHYSPRVPVYLLQPSSVFPRQSTIPQQAESSAQAILRQIVQRCPPSTPSHGEGKGKGKKRIGLLHYEDSPLSKQLDRAVTDQEEVELVPISLGLDAASAAQRLFAGMLTLERIPLQPDTADAGLGVDAIAIEGCSDEGLGLAVMERVSKAVGGGGVVGDVTDGQVALGSKGGGTSNTFWVDVTNQI
ncbi:Sua5/YciO/YrdC/YwlC family tRNA threonylcarbamoyl adenosine modification protein [Kwoniella dejecticola CBS 10117]|uniref:Threonylcarbamoyl-AMP synthase n=1 Tax=Kwoniella dejecticola CBS 10117 TaxID=1296121 RepID=A0A1A6A734_9TREE|nr:Sua5/YciO/YrdC/YwlC family protein [Kwoniella dejecticola CBS 10117]OBR85870.1 Sua5/YciO/YrdC/YwlC family protein [Kwoniella dejecticola CBS 10117]